MSSKYRTLGDLRDASNDVTPDINIDVRDSKSSRTKTYTISVNSNDINYLFRPDKIADAIMHAIKDRLDLSGRWVVKLSVANLEDSTFNRRSAESYRLHRTMGVVRLPNDYNSLHKIVLAGLDRSEQYDTRQGTNNDYFDLIHKGKKLSSHHYINRVTAFEVVLETYTSPSGGATPKNKLDFKVESGLCGPASLFYFTECNNPSMLNVLKKFRVTANTKSNSLMVRNFMTMLGIESNMTMADFAKYTTKYPTTRVRIVRPSKDSVGVDVLYDHIGSEYEYSVINRGKDCFIGYEAEHYYYVKELANFGNVNNRNRICNVCMEVMTSAQFNKHDCVNYKCPCCLAIFADDAERVSHMQTKTNYTCERCNFRMLYSECAKYHSCSNWKCPSCADYCRMSVRDKHKCHHIQCNYCSEYIPKNLKDVDRPYELSLSLDDDHKGDVRHRCTIQSSKLKENEYDIYVFDFEALRGDNGNQVVSIVCVEQLYITPTRQWTFESLEQFDTFMCGIRTKSLFIAHNGAKYDFILLYSYLLRVHPKYIELPRNKVVCGNDIISFEYHKITFHDSLKHLGTSLDKLAKSFGLSSVKGYFPYDFYTVDNRAYIGAIPDKKFFKQSSDDKEFCAWYDAYKGKYDIHKECIKYCKLDVQILRMVVERYIEASIGNPILYPTVGSYTMNLYRSHYMPSGSIDLLCDFEYSYLRDSGAYQGGRTETFKTYVKSSTGIRYLDINSLYPAVMRYDYLPSKVKGYYTIGLKGDEAVSWLKELHSKRYLAVLKYRAYINNIHIPVLGIHKDGKLIFPVGNIEGGTTSIELMEAVNQGYSIEILDAMIFESRNDLFAGFIDTNYAIKKQCDEGNGTPGERFATKLRLNNLWGKFGERSNKPKVKLITNNMRWDAYVKKFHSGELDMEVLEDTDEWVEFIVTETKITPKTNTNLALAIFVTANARLRLYNVLSRYGKEVVYCDTDSVFVEDSADPMITSTELGAWKDELDGGIISEMYSSGPKMYYCEVKDQPNKPKIASKGFKPPVDYKQMLHKMLFNTSVEDVDTIRFKRSRKGIMVEEYKKHIKTVMTKRCVLDDHTTVPIVIE